MAKQPYRSQTQLRNPAARRARVVHETFALNLRGRGECRVPAAPAASRAKQKAHEQVTTGPPETPGIPARNGFNGLFRALPGDEFVLSPSSANG
jgi:hypothetical protein